MRRDYTILKEIDFGYSHFLVGKEGVPKKRPKNVSQKKIYLQVFPHFLGNQCPMNLSTLRILMVLNLSQGKAS